MKKSQLVPAQKVTVLGAVIDSVQMKASLPQEKECKILELIQTTLDVHHITIHQLDKVIGKLLSCTIACPLGCMYFRHL